MSNLKEITTRLNQLIRQHNAMGKEIKSLIQDLETIKSQETPTHKVEKKLKQESKPVPSISKETPIGHKVVEKASRPSRLKREGLEEFVGGNVLNKIGIVILIIGVGFGIKYAIDKQLLSPAIRIVMAYVTGLILAGIAWRLKDSFKNYSAVLMSGGIAIFYLTTFLAFDLYGLIPKMPAFILMVIFTLFAVVAALWYDYQVIGIIGLVGAYAVPFLLDDQTGNIRDFFIYVSIINAGIVFLAFKKYWRWLNYVAFISTWTIFISWLSERYDEETQISLAFIAATVFFFIFYGSFLLYKLVHEEKYTFKDVLFLLLNSFIYYGLAYDIISDHPEGENFLGLFTAANALVHAVVSYVIFKKGLHDKNVFYLVMGLVITFLTLAIPVQLEGRWVTLFWIIEAVVLFMIGRNMKVSFYEVLSYPLLIIATFSLLDDWSAYYADGVSLVEDYRMRPIFNLAFLTSLIYLIGLGTIYVFQRRIAFEGSGKRLSKFIGRMQGLVAILLALFIYLALFIEIRQVGYQYVFDRGVEIDGYMEYPMVLLNYFTNWQFIFAMAFLSLLVWGNDSFWKDKWIQRALILISSFVIIEFLTYGLAQLNDLRHHWVLPAEDQIFSISAWSQVMRYVAYAVMGALMWFNLRAFPLTQWSRLRIPLIVLIHIGILVALSYELQNVSWLIGGDEIVIEERNPKFTRAGLSILWGVYALGLIVMGFARKKQYLRVMAIILFGITLIKVFIFDLARTSTLNKVIIFVALGILLLIISYVYQRYKQVLIGDEGTNEI